MLSGVVLFRWQVFGKQVLSRLALVPLNPEVGGNPKFFQSQVIADIQRVAGAVQPVFWECPWHLEVPYRLLMPRLGVFMPFLTHAVGNR